MFQHLDDPETHEVPPSFRVGVHRRAAQIRRRRVSVSAFIVVAVVVGFGASALAWVNKRDSDIQRVHLADGTLVAPAPSEPVDIVLVGIDHVAADDVSGVVGEDRFGHAIDGTIGRADAIMLVRFDPDSKSLRLLSFPRDLLDPRTGKRFDDALVTDPAAIVDSVHLLMPIPIHHYIELDFAGFGALVEELGGVRIALSAPISDALTGLALPAGCSTLDRHTALALVRARHLVVDGVDDPRGDLGRTERQQAFIAAALAQLGAAPTDPLSLDRYARILADHAVLDDTLDLSDLVALARQLRSVDPANVSALTFPSSMTTLNGAAVLTASAADVDLARQFLLNGTVPEPDNPPPAAPALTIEPC